MPPPLLVHAASSQLLIIVPLILGSPIAGAAACSGALHVNPPEQAENLLGRDPCRNAEEPRPAVPLGQPRLEHLRIHPGSGW